MIDLLLDGVRIKAERAANTAAIGFGAGLALAIGIAFWTAAGWMFLITLTTPLNAAVMLGAFFSGAGIIGFGIIAARRRRRVVRARKAPPPPPAADMGGLLAAFMTGLSAGSRERF